MAHFEDYDLAREVHRELMTLRTKSATSKHIDEIARKAGIAGTTTQSSRAMVDAARADAWLAICGLAKVYADNEAATAGNEPDKIVETSPYWASTIDKTEAWVRAAE
jgi:hypothetical protein